MLNDPNFNEQELTAIVMVLFKRKHRTFERVKTNCKLFQLVAQ
jgi:hypothetical protein